MKKEEAIKKEKEKLEKVFANIDKNKKELVEQLIDQAANLTGELIELYSNIKKNKSVIVSSKNPAHQLITESAKLYNKYLNTYAVVVKTLNGILEKNLLDENDELDDFEKAYE